MQPFHVQCETCGARLKVRDAVVIGEIHACPRCESMVLIAAPTGWNAPPAAPSPVSAPTEVIRPGADFVHVVPPSEAAADAFAAAAALAMPPTSEAEVTAAHEPVPETTVELPATPTSWLLSLTRTRLLLGSVAGATLLALGGLATVLFSGSDQPIATGPPTPLLPSTAASTQPSEPASVATAATAPAAASSPPSGELLQEPIAITAVKPVVSPFVGAETESRDAEALAPTTSTSTADTPDASSSQVAPTSAAAEPSATTPQTTPQAAQPTPSPDEGRRAPVLKFDPLGFDPAQLSLESIAAATATPAGSSPSGPPPSETNAPATADEEPPAEELLQPPAEQPSITVRLGPTVGDAPAPMEIVEALSLRVDAFSVTAMPLERFVAVLSDMMSVPITLEPVALQLAGTVPTAPVTVNVTQQSLEQLLQGALAKHRLALRDVAGHLTIQLASADERSTKVHDVADLVAEGAQDAASVAATIERFVSPGTWTAGGGTGKIQVEGRTLRVEQSKAVQHEIVVFCERLRLARGLRQQTRYPADQLAIDSPYVAIDSKLNERTTFTFLPWTRLADVVRHWQQASGLTILVDWSSLASEELAPSTTLACSAVDQPWGEALDQILEPLGLAWWAVDSGTIQITHRDALVNIQLVEFHRVPKTLLDQFTSSEALVDSLQKDLSGQLADNPSTSAGDIQMQFDSPSNRLIARARPHVHQRISERIGDKPKQ